MKLKLGMWEQPEEKLNEMVIQYLRSMYGVTNMDWVSNKELWKRNGWLSKIENSLIVLVYGKNKKNKRDLIQILNQRGIGGLDSMKRAFDFCGAREVVMHVRDKWSSYEYINGTLKEVCPYLVQSADWLMCNLADWCMVVLMVIIYFL